MSEGEGKYHKQWQSTVASKALLLLMDSDEVKGDNGSAER
jgi:hypothetical protein